MKTTLRRRAAALGLAIGLLALSACGGGTESSSGSDESAGSGDWKPVTIEHAFGETVIDEKPERVVTLGWGSTDAALALGVVPVGMEVQMYGGNDQGVLPWVEDALEEAGAETPEIIKSADETEQIITTKPDLILAPYSGLTQEQYDALSGIPGVDVVAYPETPWTTPWRETVEIVGQALGKTEEAKAVLDEIDAAVQQKAEEHPEFQGKTIATLADDTSTLWFYTPSDPRTQFLEDLGFTTAPSVEKLSEGKTDFTLQLSFEKADALTSDVLVTYAADEAAEKAFLSKPSVAALPQVKSGATARIVGESLVASMSPPTALSATWGLDELVDQLAEAVTHVK